MTIRVLRFVILHGLFEGTGRFFRHGNLSFFASAWSPGIDGLVETLAARA